MKRAQGGARAVVQTIGSRLLIQVLNAATGILTARTLLPTGRGQLAAMTLWPLFFAGLTTFGIPSSLVYFLRSRPERRGDLIAGGLAMSALLGVFTGVVGAIFIPHWLHQYPDWEIRDAQWLMIVTPIWSVTFVGRAILESHSEFSTSNLSQILYPLVSLITLLILLVTHRLTVLSAALAYVVAIVPVSALLVRRVLPYVDRKARPAYDGCRLLLSYGVRSYGIDLLGTLSLQVDQVLVVSILSPSSMGLYVVMLGLSRMANVFQNSVTAVLFPKATGQSTERILELTGRAARVSLSITACATFLIGVIGPFLLRVFYGKDYTSAIGCLRILLLEVTISGWVFILAQAFMALDHPGTVSLLQAVGLGMSVPLMLLLIPRFGITGAALALLLSTIARLCFICAGFRIFLKVPVPDFIPTAEDYQALIRGIRKPVPDRTTA
jgi:O-antigen/teichoic acid export membrane protein